MGLSYESIWLSKEKEQWGCILPSYEAGRNPKKEVGTGHA